jgi:hypothetical protein
MNKGMPFWEQHLEKMVLGLAVVLLLAVFSMMMLDTADITAEIGGRKYGPSEVDEVMVTRAEELGRQLAQEAPADTEALAAIDGSGSELFLSRIRQGVSPSSTLPRIAPSLAASLLPEDVGAVDVWYHEPKIPAPRIQPVVAQTVDTIQATEFDRVAGLSQLVTTGGDVVWTTPVATLDLAAIRQELARDAAKASPPRSAVPSNWYNARPYVLDVVFERQVLGVDGSWGSPEVVDILPGAIELRGPIRDAKAANSLNASFREFVWLNLDDRVQQLGILQPDFYGTLNDRWTPPLTAAATDTAASESTNDADAERRREERELQSRIEKEVAAAKRLEATLQELGGPLREEDEPAGGGAGAGAGRGASGGGRGSGAGGRGGGGPGDDPNGGGQGFGSGAGRKSGSSEASAAERRKRVGLTLRLDRRLEEIQRLKERLAELNPDADSAEVATVPGAVIQLPDLASEGELRVWTHDLSVTQGQTYRYRCHAVLFNPFFARGRQLLPEQEGLAEAFGIPSTTSDWSDPVTIDPPVEFFVVKASDDAGSLGLGEARIELYRYFDGALRAEQITFQPGDRIGLSRTVDGIDVDFTTDWYLVDVIADPAAAEGPSIDREENAIVVCRRLDGLEVQRRVPSREQADPKRRGLRFDAEAAAEG